MVSTTAPANAVEQSVHGKARRLGGHLDPIQAEVEPCLQVGAGHCQDGAPTELARDDAVGVARDDAQHLQMAQQIQQRLGSQ